MSPRVGVGELLGAPEVVAADDDREGNGAIQTSIDMRPTMRFENAMYKRWGRESTCWEHPILVQVSGAAVRSEI